MRLRLMRSWNRRRVGVRRFLPTKRAWVGKAVWGYGEEVDDDEVEDGHLATADSDEVEFKVRKEEDDSVKGRVCEVGEK
jgi:hypothetical protein